MSTCLIWIFGFHIDSVKQPIKRDSVASGHVSYRWTPAFNDHLDRCFTVFKYVKHDFNVKKFCVGEDVVHIE